MKSADWLAERFGLSGPVTLDGPVDRGFQGQVWRLTCGSRAYAWGAASGAPDSPPSPIRRTSSGAVLNPSREMVVLVTRLVPMLVNAVLILVATSFMPAVAENAMRATTRAYSIRS